jgi:hypothetical protein
MSTQADFSCTINDTPGSVVQAPCTQKCRVTYLFKFKSPLNMPYAVAVNGATLSEFAARPRKTTARISLLVHSGERVSLFLNSDAHPDYRNHAVYSVTPDGHDIEVTIHEKNGKHSEPDTPILRNAITQPVTMRQSCALTRP